MIHISNSPNVASFALQFVHNLGNMYMRNVSHVHKLGIYIIKYDLF